MSNIDRNELSKVAYSMVAAYKQFRTLGEATHHVSSQYPDLDTSSGVLSGMWLAIDACIDLTEPHE